MSQASNATVDLLNSIVGNLEAQNIAMLDLRDLHCGSSTAARLEASLAVDEARNKVAQALHCLRRCATRLEI